MIGAMRTGVRFVRHAPALRAIFVRAAAFITCASALMALLPILARHNLGLGSLGFGILLGSFGMGAVAGALILPEIRRRISIDMQVTLSTILFAVVFLALAYLQNFIILCGAILTAGAAWLTLLSIFNSSVQSMAPSWVRGRALAVYMFIFFGGMAAGAFSGVRSRLTWGSPGRSSWHH
jgi:predicted MFS family arabinose efflux permease